MSVTSCGPEQVARSHTLPSCSPRIRSSGTVLNRQLGDGHPVPGLRYKQPKPYCARWLQGQRMSHSSFYLLYKSNTKTITICIGVKVMRYQYYNQYTKQRSRNNWHEVHRETGTSRFTEVILKENNIATLQFTGIMYLVLSQIYQLTNFAITTTRNTLQRKFHPIVTFVRRVLSEADAEMKIMIKIWPNSCINPACNAPKSQSRARKTVLTLKFCTSIVCSIQEYHPPPTLCSPCIPIRKPLYRFHKFWVNPDLLL